MEEQEVVESIIEDVQEQAPAPAQTINTDAIGEALAAAGRR